MDDVLVGKVTISASLMKIHFPKISEQAPLRLMIMGYIFEYEVTESWTYVSINSDFVLVNCALQCYITKYTVIIEY